MYIYYFPKKLNSNLKLQICLLFGNSGNTWKFWLTNTEGGKCPTRVHVWFFILNCESGAGRQHNR